MAFVAGQGVGRVPRERSRVGVEGLRQNVSIARRWGGYQRKVPVCSAELVPRQEEYIKSAAVPKISDSKRKTLVSLGILVGTDKFLVWAFAKYGIPFPSSLFGMLGMLGLLLVLDTVRPSGARQIVKVYQPGVDLLAKWLAVCFAPSLVVLPLAPMPASADLIRTVVVILFGWLTTLLAVAYCTIGLQKLAAGRSDPSSKGGSLPAMVMPPYGRLSKVLGASCLGLLALSITTNCYGAVVALYTLSATLLGFCVGSLFSPPIKKVLHPLITCAITTIIAIGLLAKFSGVAATTLLAGYVTRSRDIAMVGGGDILLSMLGPAVISFAFQMYARKKLMQSRLLEVAGSTLVASLIGLFGTAFFARILQASEGVRLFLIPRQLTAPLAIRTAEILGADVGLALSVVVLTGLVGANFATTVLDLFRIKDPAARGLATGSSSHGLGTAAIAVEPDAFPFSAIAMALVALTSTLLVCVAPVRTLLLRVALGRVLR